MDQSRRQHEDISREEDRAETADNAHTGRFRSGVAARLAGIPVETLRVWERRYKISEAHQSPGGQRLYSKAEIYRFTLLKRLVDLGQSISALAHLDLETLETMQTTLLGLERSQSLLTASTVRVALIGPVIGSERVQALLSGPEITVIAACSTLTQAKVALQDTRVSILMIEFPVLIEDAQEELIDLKQACGAGKAMLFYRFAPSAVIRRLRLAGYAAIRAPIDADEIESLCRSVLSPSVKPEPPNWSTSPGGLTATPRFDSKALAMLSQLKSEVYCECPSQLAELLSSVNSFEQYSNACANRGPEDQAIHEYLGERAAQARMILEEALTRLLKVEGISLPHEAPSGQNN